MGTPFRIRLRAEIKNWWRLADSTWTHPALMRLVSLLIGACLLGGTALAADLDARPPAPAPSHHPPKRAELDEKLREALAEIAELRRRAELEAPRPRVAGSVRI